MTGTWRKYRSYVASAVLLFVVSLAQHWTRPTTGVQHYFEAVSAAIGLNKTGTLSDPFNSAPTGPTAHIAPAFPYGAALVLSEFGTGKEGAFALNFCTNLAVSLLVAMLPLASYLVGLDFLTGLIAGAFYLAARVPLFAEWEANYAALLCMILTILVVRFVTKKGTIPLAAAIGLVWGVTILTNAAVAILYVVWLLYISWKVVRQRTLAPLFLALACLPIVVVAPWVLRNYLTFGRFVPVRDNFGLELQVSNNPCSDFSVKSNIFSRCFSQYHPYASVNEASRIRTLGEVRYNDAKSQEAITWIKGHPRRFLELGALRFAHFWFPAEAADLRLVLQEKDYRQYSLTVWLMTLLSPVGLYLLYRTNRSLAIIFSLWLCLFPLVYYFVQYDQRFRVPILWITFLLAGHAIACLLKTILLRFDAYLPFGRFGSGHRAKAGIAGYAASRGLLLAQRQRYVIVIGRGGLGGSRPGVGLAIENDCYSATSECLYQGPDSVLC
jgi:hypothetical protein